MRQLSTHQTTPVRGPCPTVLAFLCLGLGSAISAADVPLKDQPHLRRPIASAWLVEGKLLAVANQRSGSISIVDIEKRKVLKEAPVGERLADVASLPLEGWLLAVDEKRHELLVLQWDEDELRIAERIAVSRHPVSIAVSPAGSRCTVASLWSRTITTFGMEAAEGPSPPELNKLGELALSFAPREQMYLPDSEHVLVADAFTGQMAVLDVAAQSVLPIFAKNVFRIYGMALSSDPGGLLIAHQTAHSMRMSKQAPGDAGTNDQAKVLNNFVGEYSIDGLLEGRLERFIGTRDPKSRSGYFPGDLREMAELAPGPLTVTVEGHHQSLEAPAGQTRVRVRRFWDELVLSDSGMPPKETRIKLGPPGTPTAVDRGEALFYATNLSANGWMSCNTCHPAGHTTGQLVDTLGDGSRGTHKRALTLLGCGQTGKWAWGGDVSLHSQVLQSLQKTMGKKTTPQKVNDITAFVQTLPPPPPLKPASDDPADKEQLTRGEAVFRSLGCVDCHDPERGYTSDATYDVGLRDEKRMTRFNPPSLRGVSQGYSFFHDGRATKLEDVFSTHGHPHGEAIPDDQLADLLRYLSSL